MLTDLFSKSSENVSSPKRFVYSEEMIFEDTFKTREYKPVAKFHQVTSCGNIFLLKIQSFLCQQKYD